jgi:hypothetical protein
MEACMARPAAWYLLVGIGALASCDTTEPGVERTLHVEGMVLEDDQPPLTPLHLHIEAWVPGLSVVSADLTTDAEGRYDMSLGPTLAEGVDSVRVQVRQFSCQRTFLTALTHRDLDATARDTLHVPSVSLSLPWIPAEAQSGGSSCAHIYVPTPPEGGLGDLMMLALWHDDLGDQPRGRWRLNHTASIGDDFGYFSGVRTEEGLELVLDSQYPECGAFALTIPIGGVNGTTFGPAELTHSGTCFVPSPVQIRFFDGGVLSEPALPE